MSQTSQQTGAEGWQKDPYARHELRFFDGHKWTAYVRDGETNGMDEPGGPMGDEAASGRSGLLSEELLVVERLVDLGRRWSDRTVHRADGTQAGLLRRAAPSAKASPLRALVARDTAKNDIVELVDDHDLVVLTLIRPIGAQKNTVIVRDAQGRDAGRISQQTVRRGDTTYAFLGPNGAFLGDLQAENWVAWDLRIMDTHNRQIATITRDWDGLDFSKFLRPDDYVVRIAQPVHEPLRTLVVACALSLEIAVKPDTHLG